jgi:hypothetical protein
MTSTRRKKKSHAAIRKHEGTKITALRNRKARHQSTKRQTKLRATKAERSMAKSTQFQRHSQAKRTQTKLTPQTNPKPETSNNAALHNTQETNNHVRHTAAPALSANTGQGYPYRRTKQRSAVSCAYQRQDGESPGASRIQHGQFGDQRPPSACESCGGTAPQPDG